MSDANAEAVGRVPSGRDESGLYVRLEDLGRLQSDQRSDALMREVAEFACAPRDLMAQLSAQPLVLLRALGTPNFETSRFLQLAADAGRPPLVLETREDWFHAANISKRALGKMPIFDGFDRHGNHRMQYVKIFEFGETVRKRISEITCNDGRSLVELHHELSVALFGREILSRIICGSNFYAGHAPQSYYERVFALLTCFGALAESFSFTGAEQAFTETVVLPAFEATRARFGASPMIVRLLPEGTETDLYWDGYPVALLPLALQAARHNSSPPKE